MSENNKKIFKGKDVNIGSVQPGTPIQFVEKLPANQWGQNKLPNVAMVTTSTENWDKKTVLVNYRSPKGHHGSYSFPKEFKVRELHGSVGQVMAKNYADYAFENMIYSLQYAGSIGCDPEIFVERGDGSIFPAFDFLGSKNKPTLTPIQREAGKSLSTYWDGFQAEFETWPSSCLAWNVDSVQVGLKTVLQAARKIDKTAKLSTKTVFEVPYELLQNSAEEHVTFGCMPSFNAYGLEGMTMPARELTSRSAGGHIHFGIGSRPVENQKRIVKALDAVLGISCVSMFENFDNPVRRNFYGLPGEYRTPAHGLEYRTLSNAWMFHPLIMNIVFDLSRKCVKLGDLNMLNHFKGCKEETIEVIRGCDVKRAREIMDRNKNLITKMIKACGGSYSYDNAPEVIFNIFRNGMESAIKDPTDLIKNWNLDSEWVKHSDGTGKNVAFSRDILNQGKKV